MLSDAALVSQMQSRIQAWEKIADDRALFLKCYMLMTSNVLAGINRHEFSDSPWVDALLRHFVDYYLGALQAYETDPASAPPAWQLAYQAAANPHIDAMRKLLVGVNAHINYDLALAVVDLLRPEWPHLSDSQRADRYADYCRVNDIMGRTIDAVQDKVLDPAMPAMVIIDNLMGRVDEFMVAELLVHWRENVWHHALGLLAAADAQEQARLAHHFEQEALRIGNLICVGNPSGHKGIRRSKMAKTRRVADPIESETGAGGPRFADWARFISFQPQVYFRPQTLDELKTFLAAAQQGLLGPRRLRVLGGLHSCSELCVSDAVVDVSNLPQTIEFEADNTRVTASANWHLHDFLAALSARGKSISATGGTDHQTLAGLISTATAPASPRDSLYDLLEWVEYITVSDGPNTVVEKRVARTDPDMKAVVCSLGAVGIITRVQFRLVDELYFETVQKIVKLSDVLGDVARTSERYHFWRVDWIPDTENGLLWAANGIPSGNPQGDYPDDQSESILVALFNVLDRIESAGPLLDEAMRLIYAGLEATYGQVKVSGPLRNMLPVDRRAPLHVAMAEWSFNPADLQAVLAGCREYYRRHGWPNLPIEIELTKTDTYLMSPWNWPGLDYIVKFNFMYLTDVSGTAAEKEAIVAHLRGLWNWLMEKKIPFKAHWAKINFIDPAFAARQHEAEQFRPFMRPIFLNPYLVERIDRSPAAKTAS